MVTAEIDHTALESYQCQIATTKCIEYDTLFTMHFALYIFFAWELHSAVCQWEIFYLQIDNRVHIERFS